jgi:uncharacterized protein (TIGR00730 family)
MNRLCVYCGSRLGVHDAYVESARELASLLTASDIALVYGGADKGIMGVLAESMLELGGEVIGVIPKALQEQEIAHRGLTELHVVNSMHERKSLMAVLADGFVALPGGFGTLEEIVEVLTWGQLNFHSKPCGLLNINGYFDSLIAFLANAEKEGFLRSEHRQMLQVANTPAQLLEQFEHYVAPTVDKWSSESR